jgi:DNA-directed RNA polymerase subunit RPC12/RpoP
MPIRCALPNVECFAKMESDLFGDAEFPIKCQACGNATQIKVSDLEKNPEVACPKCGLTTNIEADELKKMRETINQAAEKFKDALRRRSK